MKLRNVLLVLAAILAGATLLLAGYEVAIRFGKRADPLQLAFAVCAVATAITCLAVLDWARNLGTEAEGRASRGRGGGDEEDARCLLYTSPSPRDLSTSRMPSSA